MSSLKKTLKDPLFWKLVAAWVVIGSLMYFSWKYEIDWEKVWQNLKK